MKRTETEICAKHKLAIAKTSNSINCDRITVNELAYGTPANPMPLHGRSEFVKALELLLCVVHDAENFHLHVAALAEEPELETKDSVKYAIRETQRVIKAIVEVAQSLEAIGEDAGVFAGSR